MPYQIEGELKVYYIIKGLIINIKMNIDHHRNLPITVTYHIAMSKPASCLEPMRSKVVPSSKLFPIVSSHHCPIELPSSPTYDGRLS